MGKQSIKQEMYEMSKKLKTAFICKNCGAQSSKWAGKCAACGEWNTIEEVIVSEKPTASATVSMPSCVNKLSGIDLCSEKRIITGMDELDRVLGGGIVKGSVVLLSGDPGIGKSTILLEICKRLDKNLNLLYISGEESAVQIKMRAERLGLNNDNLSIMTETEVLGICEYIKTVKPDFVMVDSIQTMQIDEISSSAGSLVQVRECTNVLLKCCKTLNVPLFIVGHVNKGGEIAGPKVLEHIVDTVLYFEGERNQAYRILRAIKNRFGSTNEIGVFEMNENGLSQVENPSAMLLSGRAVNVSGSCITCILEGTRPILAEVQGLTSQTGFGNPRRVSNGFDFNRLNLLLAILEKRLGLHFSAYDAYLNVVGGLKLDEPASDLAVALALVSAYKNVPIDSDTIIFGEVGLSGEIRSVPRIEARINEAERLGFKTCILPRSSALQIIGKHINIELLGVNSLAEAIALIN